LNKEILKRFKKIKQNLIIKDYKPGLDANGELIDVDIEHFDNPIFALLKLDIFLIKKFGIRNVKKDLLKILLYGILTNFNIN